MPSSSGSDDALEAGAVGEVGRTRIRKTQHLFQWIEDRDDIAGIEFKLERQQRDQRARRHGKHRGDRFGCADPPDRRVDHHARADQDQQRGLIHAEFSQKQWMELRRVEQRAIETDADQRKCRPRRHGGGEPAMAVADHADAGLRQNATLALPAPPNGKITIGTRRSAEPPAPCSPSEHAEHGRQRHCERTRGAGAASDRDQDQQRRNTGNAARSSLRRMRA